MQKVYQSRGNVGGNYGIFDKKTSTKSTISTESSHTVKKTNPYEVLFEKRQIAKSKEMGQQRPQKANNPPSGRNKIPTKKK
jgi:hypothetical protein